MRWRHGRPRASDAGRPREPVSWSLLSTPGSGSRPGSALRPGAASNDSAGERESRAFRERGERGEARAECGAPAVTDEPLRAPRSLRHGARTWRRVYWTVALDPVVPVTAPGAVGIVEAGRCGKRRSAGPTSTAPVYV